MIVRRKIHSTAATIFDIGNVVGRIAPHCLLSLLRSGQGWLEVEGIPQVEGHFSQFG